MKAFIVEKELLAHNIELLKNRAGKAVIWAVIKADGYGLGVDSMALFLAAHGIDHFAVTDVCEVRAIREAGLKEASVLMMEGSCNPDEINELLDLGAILTIGSPEDAAEIRRQAAARSTVAEVHLKVDTGMGRYGFLPSQIEQVLSLYADPGPMAFTGIYTHFFDAYNTPNSRLQFDRFQQVVQEVRAAGFDTGMVHCCNSTAFWKYPEMHCDGVRIGSALLGRVWYAQQAGLKRVGYVMAELEEIRQLPKGSSVGYGGCWKAKRDTRVAVVSIGYSNGFAVDRGYDTWRLKDCIEGIGRNIKALLLQKALYVQVNGQNCRVLGHVGMVNMVVDVTDVDCKVGDMAHVDINPTLMRGVEIRFQEREK